MAGQKPGGIAEYFDPGAKTVHRALYASTCAHCQRLTEFESQRKMLDFVDVCRGCMKLICLGCVGQPCLPAEKRAELAEQHARLTQRLTMESWRCY